MKVKEYLEQPLGSHWALQFSAGGNPEIKTVGAVIAHYERLGFSPQTVCHLLRQIEREIEEGEKYGPLQYQD